MKEIVMNDLLAALMLWIGANSTYVTADLPLPAVVPMSARELTQEAYGNVPQLVPDGGIDERLLALYAFDDGENGTIYVLDCHTAEAPDPDESPCEYPVYHERLLHELVHHVQQRSGAYAHFPCRNFGEKEAYLLGGRYLKARHVTDPLPNRNFWAHIYSRC
jgi:hypothetical protein